MALRKTSHDGADSTSITSGIENEIKKAGSNINKIKKSSIKRKVQNFSHESDDGIIEPLLQTDKEKSDIANRSAKFLLNKSKTDCSYERDNKHAEDIAHKCSVSSPAQQANELLSNNLKETPASTSYVCGMAPLHNYMNTNIFSTYDVTKGITTKSPILVEIDGSKSGIYSPSPLIFTTAKIHTDSKTKLMEPLQVTPVPILSTIEGSVIRAGGASDTDKIINSFTLQSKDLIKSTCEKTDISEVLSIKDKQTITTTPTCVSSNIEVLSSKVVSNITENQTKSTNEFNTFIKCTGFKDISQANGQLASNTNTAGISLLSDISKVSKEQMASISNVKSNIDSSNIIKPTDTRSINNFKSLSDKSNPQDKATDSLIKYDDGSRISSIRQQKLDSLKSSSSMASEIKGSTLSTDKIDYTNPSHIKNQDSTTVHDNTVNIEKSSGSKKLQRQKNACPQEIQQNVTTISKLTTTEKSDVYIGQEKKSLAEIEKPITKIDSDTIDGTTDQKIKANMTCPPDKSSTTFVTCNVASPTITSSIVSRPSATLSSTSNVKSVKTVDVVDSKSLVYLKDTAKLTGESSIANPVPNSKNTTKLSLTTTMTKTSPTESLACQNIQAIPVSGKPDITISLSSLSYQHSNQTETSFKASSPVVSTTLPSYIVSTSKTKIGSTFTSNTSTSTTKSQTSPQTEIVYTKNAPIKSSGAQQSARPTVGVSPTNGTKHPNFSKQTKSDTIIKDGRA